MAKVRRSAGDRQGRGFSTLCASSLSCSDGPEPEVAVRVPEGDLTWLDWGVAGERGYPEEKALAEQAWTQAGTHRDLACHSAPLKGSTNRRVAANLRSTPAQPPTVT